MLQVLQTFTKGSEENASSGRTSRIFVPCASTWDFDHPKPWSSDWIQCSVLAQPFHSRCHFSTCCRSLVCDGKRGLLTRLLQVMKKEPAESSFRWVHLASDELFDTPGMELWFRPAWGSWECLRINCGKVWLCCAVVPVQERRNHSQGFSAGSTGSTPASE